ncbi:hypothetical protein [Anaerotruncus colihominis]|uniref:Uncharacterized protein n=1 Tax=Anaerotruncus colihominis TaxID=169435 RepID=A0A845T5L3_9FIRM|nr:hypothetical protein [Anaerotruncus colihominis]MCR2025607.1 hypothetical protein [Anaerotruncus colihominis]NDO39681.1 hypothetical protein [Anaerotruncus colihominis]
MGIGLYGWQQPAAYAPAQYGLRRDVGTQPAQAAEPASAAAAPQENPAQTLGITAPPPLDREGTAPVELAVRGRFRYPDIEEETGKSPQETMEEAECQTCKERKYQDGSNDPGVSFKTPTNISPERAASAVRGHEMEHVVREQAKAQREGRKVVSQTVTIHTGICPECGDVYVSGGTTRTTTAKAAKAEQPQTEAEERARDKTP